MEKITMEDHDTPILFEDILDQELNPVSLPKEYAFPENFREAFKMLPPSDSRQFVGNEYFVG